MTNQTNLKQFPESMHHLVNYITKNEDRRLYSLGRFGNGREIKEDRIRKYPYEVKNIKVVPAGGAPGSIIHADFRNKKTGELDQTSLTTDGEDLIEGLEHKLRIQGSPESRQMFWNTGDYNLNNQYLKRFRGLEVTGVAIEHASEERGKYNRLIGIFID